MKVFLTSEIIKYVAIKPNHTLAELWKIEDTYYYTSIGLIREVIEDVLNMESLTVHERIIKFLHLSPRPTLKPLSDVSNPETASGLLQTASVHKMDYLLSIRGFGFDRYYNQRIKSVYVLTPMEFLCRYRHFKSF